MNVKTVSLKSPNAPQEFATSLHETGFAVVTDHPISHSLIFDTFKEWEDFFATEDKHRYTFDPKVQAGYFPFRSENAKDSKQKDLKEFYHYYPARSALPASAQTHTPQLYREMQKLADQLLGWIEESTPQEIRSQFSQPLNQMVRDSQETLLRPIHYPPLTGSEEEGAIRAAAHGDINLITLLPAATAPGLQVKTRDGKWLDIACDPGMIVINSGDMLNLASKGYYPSTIHQVVNPKGESSKLPRYSMPLFLHPRGDVRLSENHTALSYLQERLREIGLLPKA
jgi:isopenicillin N synthase-like dioxygenase